MRLSPVMLRALRELEPSTADDLAEVPTDRAVWPTLEALERRSLIELEWRDAWPYSFARRTELGDDIAGATVVEIKP